LAVLYVFERQAKASSATASARAAKHSSAGARERTAKDRAKRSDAACCGWSRVVQLPILRAAFSEQYAGLLVEARRLAQRGGVAEIPANFASLDDNPIFVGIPEVAGLSRDCWLRWPERKKVNGRCSFDSLLAQVVGRRQPCATLRICGSGRQAGGNVVVQAVTAAALERYLQTHPRSSREVR